MRCARPSTIRGPHDSEARNNLTAPRPAPCRDWTWEIVRCYCASRQRQDPLAVASLSLPVSGRGSAPPPPSRSILRSTVVALALAPLPRCCCMPPATTKGDENLRRHRSPDSLGDQTRRRAGTNLWRTAGSPGRTPGPAETACMPHACMMHVRVAFRLPR